MPQVQPLGRWFVACVQPHQEQRVAAALVEAELSFYLPMERVLRRCRTGRKMERREVVLPVFPGYVFVRLADDEALHRVKAVKGVKGFLGGVDGKPLAAPAKEIKRIRVAEASGKYDRVPRPRALERGQVLRVCKGPFLGQRAEYLSAAPGERVKVLLRAMEEEGGGIPTLIPVSDLELLAA